MLKVCEFVTFFFANVFHTFKNVHTSYQISLPWVFSVPVILFLYVFAVYMLIILLNCSPNFFWSVCWFFFFLNCFLVKWACEMSIEFVMTHNANKFLTEFAYKHLFFSHLFYKRLVCYLFLKNFSNLKEFFWTRMSFFFYVT